ncbi:hypothetical protein BDZ97DRAFT_1346256 [Flammula alnicola]|nr:hypothetical protein BDZ97DRAFT_1346256 [Flammula alnicola]
MSTQQSISRSSNLVKKVEKEILMEANNEEKSLKNSIGDLAQIEKAENKAEKAVVKADIKLEKAEKKEQSSLKDLYRAEHNHGIALVDVQKAQQELETSTRNYEKLREKLEKKATRVEEAMKAHDDHTVSLACSVYARYYNRFRPCRKFAMPS